MADSKEKALREWAVQVVCSYYKGTELPADEILETASLVEAYVNGDLKAKIIHEHNHHPDYPININDVTVGFTRPKRSWVLLAGNIFLWCLLSVLAVYAGLIACAVNV